MTGPSLHGPSRIVIAGGGMAGIEAALALRAFAGDRATVTVVSPGPRFAIPASAAGSAFGISPSVDVPLTRVVARAGAALRRSQVVAVDAHRRLAMLAGGELLGFEEMIVAVGARLTPPLPDAVTFRGHSDVEELRTLVEGVVAHAERGAEAELAVVIPAACGWPLAGYEIALMAREHLVAAGHAKACRLCVVTAERVPLEMFGALAGRAVTRTMERMDVEIVTGGAVVAFDWGRLVMSDGTSRAADRVVALPIARGPALRGLPMDADGFVQCEADGRIPEAPGVTVVGDAGTFPLRRGGIACRQADAVAAAIARRLGAEAEDPPFAPTAPATSDDGGRWWPVPKMSGRFLAPLLRELARPGADYSSISSSSGSPVRPA
jgi:sulfide:quinone oxidoreductase